MNIFQRWKQTTIANKGLVFSSALMALGTLFYAGAAITQVYIMKRSAHDASLQADKLIKAAQSQACSAQKIADASDKNAAAAESFSTSAGQIRGDTAHAVDELKRAADNAQRQFHLAETALQIDTRAWIQPGFYRDNIPITVGSEYREPFRFVNVGRTPASDVHVDVVLEFLYNTDTLEFDYKRQNHLLKAGLLFPNSPRDESIEASEFGSDGKLRAAIVTQLFKNAFEGGSAFVIMYGKMSYHDRTGQHLTTFCNIRSTMIFGYSKTIADKCSAYNQTD